ncbi:MAG: TIGR00341 family protein [Rikenellaceae bacterium]
MSSLKNQIRVTLRNFLRGRFALDEDNAKQQEVEENIRKSVEFRGQNLWILIFAILVASVGLNTNSAAVIIGAMLISPLMGPIMGFGLSLGIYDFELLKRSLRNFLFAVVVSLITSTIYFAISPLSVAQSEILARTTPSIWDVLIAFFGGLAGIVAQTRKDRTTTVIPGVAIATALMPPLCTAGYGLGTMQLEYFVGALYLFTINAVLISVATFIIVRYLGYEHKQQVDSLLERKIRNYIFAIIVVTIVPSVILGYNIVRHTIFETNAKSFVASAFNFQDSQVVDANYNYNRGEKEIEVLMIGKALSEDAIASLNNSKANFSLEDAVLKIRQQGTEGESTSQTLDKLYTVSSKLLDEKELQIKDLVSKLEIYQRDTLDVKSIARELSAISGGKADIAISKMAINNFKGNTLDTILVCILQSNVDNEDVKGKKLSEEDKERISAWLEARTNSRRVEIIDLTE